MVMHQGGARAGVPSLSDASSYEEWKQAALADDERSGAAKWRKTDSSRRYDFQVIRFRYNELCHLKARNDPQELLFYLNAGIHGNMGGMGRPALYARAKFGTKDLITNYIAELAASIEMIAAAPESVITFEEKLDFFRRASHCFGRAALMLSGGGALGPFHLGVAKALIEQGLLPRVISGSSAGAFVAALLGTHSDEDIVKNVAPGRALVAQEEMADANAAAMRGNRRLGVEELRAAIERMIPDMTFQEAYDLTGREINIAVSPSELHQSSRLLNAITSPNVFIREAVLASCAIPGIFPPVTLAARGSNGTRRSYVPSRKWVDGSVSDDLPAKRLARLYGANYFITSQTNPVVLWAVRDNLDNSIGARFLEVARSTTREWLRVTYPVAMRLMKNTYPLNVYARMAYSVAIQDYTADVNILPRRRFWDPRKLLAVLSEPEIRMLVREGEVATWPKIEMIRNCTRVGRTLDHVLEQSELDFWGRYGSGARKRRASSGGAGD
jgi:TAG lipase / steryl ester hydrolase / phospholipase A2 / LPA acyltransferase